MSIHLSQLTALVTKLVSPAWFHQALVPPAFLPLLLVPPVFVGFPCIGAPLASAPLHWCPCSGWCPCLSALLPPLLSVFGFPDPAEGLSAVEMAFTFHRQTCSRLTLCLRFLGF